MRSTLLIAFTIICSLFVQDVLAQVPDYAKDNGTGNSTFLMGSTSARKTQILYFPTDFTPSPISGTIDTLYFQYGSTGNPADQTLTNFMIRLGQTANTDFLGASNNEFYDANMDTVLFSASYFQPGGAEGDWFAIALDNQYIYDATQTLVLETSYDATTVGTWGTESETLAGRKLYSSSRTASTGTTTSTSFQDMGFSLAPTGGNDAGVTALVSPAATCGGNENVVVVLNNLGANRLDSVMIEWEFNGVPQPTLNYTDTLGVGEFTQVSLGFVNVPASSNYTIKAWTTMPNGVVDTNDINDTLTVNSSTSLNGTYTLGGVSPDFNSFSELGDALSNFGVCGPVVVNVASGTYTDSMTISAFNGSSSTNTVTIQGLDKDSVTVTYNGANQWGTFHLDGADYITIRNMSVVTTASTDAACILLTAGADYNTIEGCRLLADTLGSTFTDLFGVLFSANTPTTSASDGNAGNHNLINNNCIFGGENGIELQGGTGGADNFGNVITNNLFRMIDENAIYTEDVDSLIVKDNEIRDMNISINTDGIYNLDIGYFEISGNMVNVPDYGIYVEDANQIGLTSNVSARAYIINNMVISAADYGLFVSDGDSIDIWHNTFMAEPGMRADLVCDGLDVRNNIFTSSADFAFEDDDSNPLGRYIALDYNIYHTFNDTNTVRLGGTTGFDYTNLSDLQLAHPGLNDNSIFGDPLFLSATDLHVVGPLANNVGDNSVGITVDIDGETRPLAPALTVDIGADEFFIAANDLGVTVVDPGAPICAGTNPVSVTILNFGLNTATSATIGWTVNGVAQTPFAYGGSLVSSDDTTFAIGNYTFMDGVTYEVVAWTMMPNGVSDDDNTNDTSTVSGLETGVAAGIYTVGGLGADYANIADAALDINTYGICGPVVFNIATGTYDEEVVINNVTGASAVNTITFQGAHADSVTVTDTLGVGWGTFVLNEAQHVFLRRMTIRPRGVTDAAGVQLYNASYNTIDSCVIVMDTTDTTPDDLIGVMLSGALNTTTANSTSGDCHYNILMNSTIWGGEYSYEAEGNTVPNRGNQILNNEMYSAYDAAIFTDDQDSTFIRNNKIRNLTNSTSGAGLSITDIGYFMITGNDIIAKDYGIDIDDGNQPGVSTDLDLRAKIVNNFVMSELTSSSNYALYLTDVDSTDIWHNTTYGYVGFKTDLGYGLDVRNNIFATDGRSTTVSFAFEADDTDADAQFIALDHNIYFAPVGVDLAEWVSGFDYADLGSWQAGAPTFNQNSLEGDPIFVGPSDLHVLGVLANDVGDNTVGVTVDIDGETRPFSPSTIVDIGADEFDLPKADAGVIAVDFPNGVCPGNSDLEITFQNFGLDSIVTVNIMWSINDTMQTPLVLTGIDIDPIEDTTVALGTYNFLNGNEYDVKVWTDNPNGFADGDNSNDTVSLINTKTGLAAGVYTIGFLGADFLTPLDAKARIDSFGVCGPVEFQLAPGTYPGTISLDPVVGANATNTITINGMHKDSVLSTHDGSGGWWGTILLNGGDYYILKNMTIQTTASTDGACVQFYNGANHNVIDSCRLLMDTTGTSFTDLIGAFFSGDLTSQSDGDAGNYNVISNSCIFGGEYGIEFQGTAGFSHNYGNVIEGNLFRLNDERAIYGDDVDSIIIRNNTMMDMNISTNTDGVYITDLGYFEITGNNVHVPDYGFYLEDGNQPGLTTIVSARAKLINNMVISDADYGLYLNDTDSTDVWHNSVKAEPAFKGALSVEGLDVRNNIFASDGDYAFEDLDAAPDTRYIAGDYNIYYTNFGFIANLGGVDFATLAQLKVAAPAFNQNALSGNPRFIAADDLHLLGPLANDVGDNSVGITVDIDGETRPFGSSTTVDIGADEYNPPPNNAAVTVISFPNGVCPGGSDVVITFVNLGSDTLRSVELGWDVNGAAQTGQSWTGNLAPGRTQTLTIGNFNFTGGPFDVTAFTAMPNGFTDADMTDDTLTIFGLSTGLAAGTYTVGGSSPDFATIQDAADSINTTGICGPVVFAIRPGTYTEQVTVNEIIGSNSTNTITFTSETGDSSSVTITWPTSSSSTDPNFAVLFNGTDYVTIEKVSVTRTGISTYGHGIVLQNGADNVTIQNNHITIEEKTTSATSADEHAHIFSAETDDNRTLIQNNYFQDGSHAILLEGSGTEMGHIIRNNYFDDVEVRGISVELCLAPLITGNEMVTQSTTTSNRYIYILNCNSDTRITKNKLTGGRGYGIYISSSAGTPARPGLISNNFIELGGTSTAYGIYYVSSNYYNIYHNNININSSSSTSGRALYVTGSTSSDLKVLNNNLVNTGAGYTYYVPTTGQSALTQANYNNLFSNGAEIGYWGSGAVVSFADWQNTTNNEVNSVSVDPGYASTSDLHVSAAGIYKKGTPLASVTTDIDNESRDPNSPDIGADEFMLADNVEATAVLDPADGSCASTTTTVSVIVTNTGLNPQDSIAVTMEVLGGTTATFTDTLYGPLASGASDTLVFNVTVDNTAAGVYSFRATVKLGGDQFSDDDQVTVVRSFLPQPTVDLGADTTICDNDAVTLDAGSGFTYLWSTNETTQTISADAAGDYVVEITDNNGCTNTDTLTVTTIPAPVSGLSDAAVCDGDTYTFDAGAGATSYLWSDASTAQTLDAGTAGDYSVTIEGSNGCITTDTATLTVNALPTVDLGPDTAIAVGTTYTLDAGAGFTSYLWSDGSTNQTLDVSPSASGADTLSVTVVDANGCEGMDEVELTFFVGVEEFAFVQNMSVFPNPFSQDVTVKFTVTERVAFMDISILDISGKEITTESFTNFSGGLTRTYNLEHHSVGLYIIRITTDKGSFYHKVVKQ